jgi:two-component system, NtrC family, response regulator AtoC
MSADPLLIIEDEALFREELARHFRREGWEVVLAGDLGSARNILDSGSLDPLVVLSDLSLPDGSGLDFLEERRGNGDAAEWVFLTGYGTVPDSVRALRLGAHDFLQKPVALERLELVVNGAARGARAQRTLREHAGAGQRRYTPEAFLGGSVPARETRALLARLASIHVHTLLIEGETGTGKGLAARILHHSGRRAEGPLVEVNCAALPSELLESELIGHEPGSFTGAKGRHRGFFEQASGGTLFLDEVGEMAPQLQAKLLKAVEDRRIRRVGGERDTEVDVQLFAVSNRDLRARVAEGYFREDLYHRLSVLRVEIPPLRQRMDDLPDLVWAAVAEFNAAIPTPVTFISDRVWERLRAYAWPGNVRELRNVVERSVLLSTTPTLSEQWLNLPSGAAVPRPDDPDAVVLPLDGRMNFDEMEIRILSRALERCDGNVSAAARRLGISRQTLRYRIEKHGLAARGGQDAEEPEESDRER